MTGGALTGVRVLEIGSIVAGPFAGRLLADHGADVIKIETTTNASVRTSSAPASYRGCPRRPIPTAKKLELLELLVRGGLKRIEATAFVSPRAVPAMADAREIAAALHQWPDVRWSALVARRPVPGRHHRDRHTTAGRPATRSRTGQRPSSPRRPAHAQHPRRGARRHPGGDADRRRRHRRIHRRAGASGNVPTEELVYLCEDMGVATGCDLNTLVEAARLAQQAVGRPLPSGVLKAGGRPGAPATSASAAH